VSEAEALRGSAPGSAPHLPTFLVIGAMKAGTTSLYHYLRDHPEVFMPETKEVNFFNPRRNWRRGLAWYEGQFEGAPPGTLARGEASTSYTKYPWIAGVPQRIAATLPDVRLIYVVRQPIERMRSQYLHNLATGQEWRPIDVAFEQEPMYRQISRYAYQLERYEPFFARQRILVIDARDLRDNRVATLQRIFTFLGVEASHVPSSVDTEYLTAEGRRMKPRSLRAIRRIPKVREMSGYVPTSVKTLKRRLTRDLPSEQLDRGRGVITPDLDAALRASFRDDVGQLRGYLGPTFDGWGIA
jgi:sulfotransferase family protein